MSPVPTADADAVSMREFARRDGCDPKLVRNAVKAGRLPRRADGLIPAALVGTGWRRMNRRGGDKVRPPAATVRTVPSTAALPDEAASLAALGSGLVRDAAELLLRLVPRAALEPVLAEMAGRWRRGAIEMLLEDGVPLPGGLAAWGEHGAFNGPAVDAADWQEIEAGSAADA